MLKTDLEKRLGVRGGIARVGAVNNDTPVEVFRGAEAFGIRILLVMQSGLDLLTLSREKLLPLLSVCDGNFKKRAELFEKYALLDDYEVVAKLLSFKILTVGEARRKIEWAAEQGLYKILPLLLEYTQGVNEEEDEKLLSRLKNELAGGKKGCMKHFRENAEKFSYDRELFVLAVQKEGLGLKYASPLLRADKELALLALHADNGMDEPVLTYVSPRLYGEEDVLHLALKNNPKSITVLPEHMRTDKNVVFAALSKNGLALPNVGKEFLRDKEAVMLAVRQNPKAYFALGDSPLSKDEDVGELAVEGEMEMLGSEVFFKNFHSSQRVFLAALKKDARAMRYLPVSLKGNVAFAKQALAINKDYIVDFFYNVQKDEEIARILEG
ncbi:MAG: DUF4116 domain-containing protein [Clostridiales bacterium]|nr:DUF4116 domain-containing protein [Clostridiales bacterium]